MKTIEELRFAALVRAKDFCKDNDTQLSTITEYAPLKTSLEGGINQIIVARAINTADLKGIASAKQSSRNFMVDLNLKYQSRGAVKANELGMVDSWCHSLTLNLISFATMMPLLQLRSKRPKIF